MPIATNWNNRCDLLPGLECCENPNDASVEALAVITAFDTLLVICMLRAASDQTTRAELSWHGMDPSGRSEALPQATSSVSSTTLGSCTL
jgi:hypothetical protein